MFTVLHADLQMNKRKLVRVEKRAPCSPQFAKFPSKFFSGFSRSMSAKNLVGQETHIMIPVAAQVCCVWHGVVLRSEILFASLVNYRSFPWNSAPAWVEQVAHLLDRRHFPSLLPLRFTVIWMSATPPSGALKGWHLTPTASTVRQC